VAFAFYSKQIVTPDNCNIAQCNFCAILTYLWIRTGFATTQFSYNFPLPVHIHTDTHWYTCVHCNQTCWNQWCHSHYACMYVWMALKEQIICYSKVLYCLHAFAVSTQCIWIMFSSGSLQLCYLRHLFSPYQRELSGKMVWVFYRLDAFPFSPPTLSKHWMVSYFLVLWKSHKLQCEPLNWTHTLSLCLTMSWCLTGIFSGVTQSLDGYLFHKTTLEPVFWYFTIMMCCI